jgi:hypothetical protein
MSKAAVFAKIGEVIRQAALVGKSIMTKLSPPSRRRILCPAR